MLLEVLSAGTTTHLSRREDAHAFLFLSLNIDFGRACMQQFSLQIRRSINDLLDRTYSDNVSSLTSSFFNPILTYSATKQNVVPIQKLWLLEFKSMGDDLPEIIIVDPVLFRESHFYGVSVNVEVLQYLIAIENVQCICIGVIAK